MDPLLYSLSELYAQVSSTGKLTVSDRCGLKQMLLDEWLRDEEHQVIDRLLYAVRVGRIKVAVESELN